MISQSSHYGYFLGYFDILGFSKRLESIGLVEMLKRYKILIDYVNRQNDHMKQVFSTLEFKEAPYWCDGGDIAILSETQGVYFSDSFLIWASRTWPEARNTDVNNLKEFSDRLDNGWQFHPIPCGNFLNICNELICLGLEAGLPLRGALSMGEAFLDKEKNIYIGLPIIEAVRLEKMRRFIGVSLSKSFVDQIIPKRFLLEFGGYSEPGCKEKVGSFVLDWPRHWRKTRSNNVEDIINSLNTDNEYSSYYINTLDLIAYSKDFTGQFESPMETSTRALYKEFSFSNHELSVKVRPVQSSKVS